MSREAMKRIKTWSERCEEHPDHQQGMISEGMIRARMQEEIDELRQALETEPLYWNVADGWVYADDTSQKRVDEKAKREHEPVAWANTLDFDDDDIEIIPAKNKGKLGTGNCDIPLYTAPQKQWVGLTDEEYKIIHYKNYNYIELAQAVEAKLKEKNNA